MSKPPSLKGEKVSISGDPEAIVGKKSGAFVQERFELQKLLGEGGMGSVFVAQDRGLGRVVALKRLREELEGDRRSLRRFVLEAQIGAQLEHPNIVPLYSFERTDDGAPAIAMQLLEGQTMAEYITAATEAHRKLRATRGSFNLKDRIGTLLGVCDAIDFAHSRGVIHRDLKPENVMLGQHREVYVMDWGLARVIDAEDFGAPIEEATAPPPDASIEERKDFETSATIVSRGQKDEKDDAPLKTQKGSVMGTPQYMAPEQALGETDSIGPPADQFALGVMLLELATLRPARSHTSTMQALVQAAQGFVGDTINVDGLPIPPALAAIARRATALKASDRYPSVATLAEDIRHFIRDEPVSVYEDSIARRLVRIAARRPAIATALFASVIVIAAVAVIGGLVRSAHQAEQHARDLEGTRRAIVAVTTRAHVIDVHLSDLSTGVDGIAAASLDTLEHDGPRGGAHIALPPPAHLTPSPAYDGVPISFAEAVISWPERDKALAPFSVFKLHGLERWLRRSLVNALPLADRANPIEALMAGKSSLVRAFIAVEDGGFIQLPAREIPTSNDARKRPWYAMSVADPSLHWTRPVVDMDGKTLRIQALVGIISAKGHFLGVAGCDMRVTTLAHDLDLDLEGFRRAYLATEDGKIAISDDLETRVLSGQAKDVESLTELPPVDDAHLKELIASKSEGGYFEDGGKLIVYARLISPPWTYVVELNAAPYISAKH